MSFVLYSVKVLYCIAFWMLNQFCVPETNPQLPFEWLDCELHWGLAWLQSRNESTNQSKMI